MSELRQVEMGPRESQGFLLGLRVPQLLLILAAAGVTLLLLNSHSAGQAFFYLALIAGLLGVAFLPFHGRNLDQYVPVIANFAAQRFTGENVFRGGPFRDAAREPRLRLPGAQAHLRLVHFDAGGSSEQVAVIKDARKGFYTGVLAVEGRTLPLEETTTQMHHMEGFGRLLDIVCNEGSLIGRLQILERTEPDSGEAMARDFETNHQSNQFVADSYRELIAGVDDVQQAHEAYVAVSLDGRKAARDIRRAGGGDEGAAAVLFREMNRVADGLRDAGVEVLGWCPPRLMGWVIRTAYDPASRRVLDHRGGAETDDLGGDVGLPSGVDPNIAGPMRAENQWDHYRTDSAVHRVWWAYELPRRPVPAGFLWPLLLSSTCRRTVSMVIEPISAPQARRRVNVKASNVAGEQALRDKIRRRTTRRDVVEAAHVDRREQELVDGHGMPRIILYVSTSAATVQDLDDQAVEIQRLAQQSHLELAVLYGEQDQAFAAAALPLAQGLR